MVKLGLWISLLVGVTLFAGLLAVRGIDDVLAAFAAAGWGVGLVSGFYFAIVMVSGLAWACLLTGLPPGLLPRLLVMRWIGNAVNQLLPVAQLGGEVLRARLLAGRGIGGARAGASVVVDMTAGLASQAVFTVAGVLLLATGGGAADLWSGVVLIVLVAAMALVFLRVQRRGFFGHLARLTQKVAGGRDLARLTGGAAALDRAVGEIYGQPWRFAWCCLVRLLVWLLHAAETWLIFLLIGHPISFAEAIVIESLVQAVRSAGFMVPGALGIQEGGYLVFVAAVGAPADLGLAVSLMKRARDLITGLPALGLWQAGEIGRLARRRSIDTDGAAVGGEQMAAPGVEADTDPAVAGESR